MWEFKKLIYKYLERPLKAGRSGEIHLKWFETGQNWDTHDLLVDTPVMCANKIQYRNGLQLIYMDTGKQAGREQLWIFNSLKPKCRNSIRTQVTLKLAWSWGLLAMHILLSWLNSFWRCIFIMVWWHLVSHHDMKLLGTNLKMKGW